MILVDVTTFNDKEQSTSRIMAACSTYTLNAVQFFTGVTPYNL